MADIETLEKQLRVQVDAIKQATKDANHAKYVADNAKAAVKSLGDVIALSERTIGSLQTEIAVGRRPDIAAKLQEQLAARRAGLTKLNTDLTAATEVMDKAIADEPVAKQAAADAIAAATTQIFDTLLPAWQAKTKAAGGTGDEIPTILNGIKAPTATP